MRVVLGVCGSVAAYRAADLVRDLMRAGCEVRVCLTDAAQQFVSAALFEALTGQPCLQSVFEEPERGRMAHIDWARRAQVLAVVPATANTINKLAHGFADDMLSSIALAYEGPLVVAPAMNPSMYAHETTQASLSLLAGRGVVIVEPTEGDVACGESGQGKLAANAVIVEAILAAGRTSEVLRGQKVVITSGPTQEPIDSVRYLSNHSSGKMGAALARAAVAMGAEVVVISGPAQVSYPSRATVIRVKTAQQMGDALLAEAKDADWVVGAAAVADFRPADPIEGKIRRTGESLSLKLTPNEDLVAKAGAAAKPGAKIVGFAAEPDEGIESGRSKLERKGLFAIAVNDISRPGLGFGSENNALTLLFREGEGVDSGVRTKTACGWWFWETLLSR